MSASLTSATVTRSPEQGLARPIARAGRRATRAITAAAAVATLAIGAVLGTATASSATIDANAVQAFSCASGLLTIQGPSTGASLSWGNDDPNAYWVADIYWWKAGVGWQYWMRTDQRYTRIVTVSGTGLSNYYDPRGWIGPEWTGSNGTFSRFTQAVPKGYFYGMSMYLKDKSGWTLRPGQAWVNGQLQSGCWA